MHHVGIHTPPPLNGVFARRRSHERLATVARRVAERTHPGDNHRSMPCRSTWRQSTSRAAFTLVFKAVGEAPSKSTVRRAGFHLWSSRFLAMEGGRKRECYMPCLQAPAPSRGRFALLPAGLAPSPSRLGGHNAAEARRTAMRSQS